MRITFLSGLNGVISLALSLVLTISLHFSKIWTFVVRSKVHHNFGIVTCHFLFILFDTTLDDDIHVLVSISLSIYNLSSLILLKSWVIKYLPTLLYINTWLPLLRIIKNLLKQSILSNLSIFLLPGGRLYSSLIALMFSSDCIYILLRISLTDGISIGGLSFNLLS